MASNSISRSGASTSSPSSSASRKRSATAGPSKRPRKLRSPFPDFGSYMDNKNSKLRRQFDNEVSHSSNSSISARAPGSGVFIGVSIFVDGFTSPSSQELRAIMANNGGRFENYFSRHRVTHIICSHLPDSKMRNFRSFSRGLPVVKPEWVVDSLAANKLLSCVPYHVMMFEDGISRQQKLSSFFASKSILPSMDIESLAKTSSMLNPECSLIEGEECLPMLLSRGDEFFCSSKPFVDEQTCEGVGGIFLATNDNVRLAEIEDEHSVVETYDSHPQKYEHVPASVDVSNKDVGEVDVKLARSRPEQNSITQDPNFVENYFKNSRLHFIGTWRNRYRKIFASRLTEAKTINNNLTPMGTNNNAAFIHIDMDCFFVSVIVRNHPELIDKPVAVCHSNNPQGTAEISSANYPARHYGIKAGMFVREAKARCPHLVIFPYDFEAYEEVADRFYTILHKHSNKVQALSCDEAFLDVTECGGNDPVEIASLIRNEIAETTHCTASAGISGNLLLARLATKYAKPNGQFFIPSEMVESYLKDLPVKALPGIGHALEEKLRKMQIQTCGELQMVPKEFLVKDFGFKVGDMLWNYCRGIDNRSVELVQETKSVGAEVNWGVRFTDVADCHLFLMNLCKEVCLRLDGCGVQGRTITLKIKKRRKGAEDPAKFMGHGDCENISRSTTLPVATCNATALQRISKQIFSSLNIDVKEVRGVGLQISKLENADVLKPGHESNNLESWLVSASESSKRKGNEVNEPYDQIGDADFREIMLPSSEHNSKKDVAPSSSTLVGLCDVSSQENNTSSLPPLPHLDLEVIKNLPADIVSEMNDLYNGKLSFLLESHEAKAVSVEQIDVMPESLSQADISVLQQLPEDLKADVINLIPLHRGTGSSSNILISTEGPYDPHEEHPQGGKIELWAGNPPNWIKKFQSSNSTILNAIAKIYARPGVNCLLSSALQSVASILPLCNNSDVEFRDIYSNLPELLMQYIDLKIASDIEELYICFRYLKRFSSISDIFLQVYNRVLPFLQTNVHESYGGQLSLG